MKRFMLLVAVSAVAIGVVAALPASSGAVTCKLKAHHKVKCPTSQLTGPQGPSGPAGPQGPAGSGAAAVVPFKFLATGATSNTTIATFNGAIAEAGCAGGTFNQARLRSTADNGAGEVVNPRLNNFNFDPDFDNGQTIGLTTAGASDDQHLLVYLSANGTQSVSAHYGAYDGALVGGQYDCAIFGAAEVI